MRRALAIVFSLFLVLGQWAAVLPASGKVAKSCDICDCNMVSCCVAPAPTSAPNNPPASAPSQRVLAQQLVAALDAAACLILAPVSDSKSAASVFETASRHSSVPLYCWNCTLLI